jgi:hypothetical protein
MTDVVVFDLATVRFRRSQQRSSMSMLAASGETLAVVDTLATTSNQDAAFSCCEHALSAARPKRDGRRLKVALYNPYSAQISYGAGSECVVLGDGMTLELGPYGTIGHFDGDVLDIDGRRVPAIELTTAAASRAWVANEHGGAGGH